MRLDGAAKFLVFPLNICGRWNLTEFTAFRRPEKLPKENMIRGVKSILQNNLVNLDDEKFYNDEKFNALFEKWRVTKDKWIKPSLDHIKAKCNGGTLLLDNLQFISWLENRAKVDIDQDEWDSIKARIGEYF